MELIIKGDESKIKSLEKELRLRAKRHGLEMSIKDVNTIDVKAEIVPPIEPVITNDVLDLVVEDTVETVEDINVEGLDVVIEEPLEPVVEKEVKKASKK